MTYKRLLMASWISCSCLLLGSSVQSQAVPLAGDDVLIDNRPLYAFGCLSSMSSSELPLSQFSTALLETTTAIVDAVPQVAERAHLFVIMADSYKCDQRATAAALLSRALVAATAVEDAESQGEVLLKIATAYYESLDNVEKMGEVLERAIALADDLSEYPDIQQNIYRNVATAYFSSGQAERGSEIGNRITGDVDEPISGQLFYGNRVISGQVSSSYGETAYEDTEYRSSGFLVLDCGSLGEVECPDDAIFEEYNQFSQVAAELANPRNLGGFDDGEVDIEKFAETAAESIASFSRARLRASLYITLSQTLALMEQAEAAEHFVELAIADLDTELSVLEQEAALEDVSYERLYIVSLFLRANAVERAFDLLAEVENSPDLISEKVYTLVDATYELYELEQQTIDRILIEAERLALQLEDSDQKAVLLEEIAIASEDFRVEQRQSEHENVYELIDEAYWVTDEDYSYDEDGTLTLAARDEVNQYLSAAEALIQPIQDNEAKDDLLSRLALAYSFAGDSQNTRRIVLQFVQFTAEGELLNVEDYFSSRWSFLLSDIGEYSSALQIAKSVQEDADGPFLAGLLVEKGQYDLAEDVLMLIEALPFRVEALTAMANAYKTDGQSQKAFELMAEAIDLAQTYGSAYGSVDDDTSAYWTDAQTQLISQNLWDYAYGTDLERVQQLLQRIDDDEVRAAVWLDFADGNSDPMLPALLLGEVVPLFSSLDDSSLVNVATYAALMGFPQQALEALVAVDSSQQQVFGLLAVSAYADVDSVILTDEIRDVLQEIRAR